MQYLKLHNVKENNNTAFEQYAQTVFTIQILTKARFYKDDNKR